MDLEPGDRRRDGPRCANQGAALCVATFFCVQGTPEPPSLDVDAVEGMIC